MELYKLMGAKPRCLDNGVHYRGSVYKTNTIACTEHRAEQRKQDRQA